MTKWNITPATINNSMTSQVNINNDDEINWKVFQDETNYLEEAKRDRENSKHKKKDIGYKKFATIPDIVSIEILNKYGLDIHSTTFMHDPDKKKKLIQIIKTDYPHLMSY